MLVMPSNNIIHRCLIPVTIAFMLGLTLGIQLPGHWPVAIIGCTVPGIWMIRTVWHRGTAIVWPVIFCIFIGYVCIQPWLGVGLPSHHISRFIDQGRWKMEGTVADVPQWDGRRLQFVLAAAALSREGQQHAVSGKVKVSTRSRPPQLQRGDVVTLSGRLRAIRNFANPGGFDYARYLLLRGIRVRTYARKGSLKVLAFAKTKHWTAWLDSQRQDLARQMDAVVAHGNPDASKLLKALIIGQRDQVSKKLRQEFNAAGVSHVLAISGLHIGMVAAAAFALVRWLLSWIPMMLVRGWTRKGAALASFLAVLAYALLAGMSPSTQRATIMVAVVLAGCWIGRRNDWFNGLAIAALIILIVYPPALLSISFQLSFVAVLAIVVGLTVIPIKPLPFQAVWWRRWVQRWKAFMWVSGVAILGTLPLSLYYFNQTSLVGLATNMVVVPLVGMVVVPAGLLGVLALAVSPYLAGILWVVAVKGIDIILYVVHTVAQWPWSLARSVTPTLGELILYYISMGVALGWQKIPRRRLVVMTICALWMVDAAYWHHQRFGRQDMRVTAVDVGQGTANLLQLPGGYTVLVDGGGFSDNTVFDVGERILAPLLWCQKIRHVDLVVLSHPNSDHLNGLLYILRHFNVSEVWSNHRPARTLGYGKWVELINDKGIKHTAFKDLPKRQVRHGASFNILGPPRNFMQLIGHEPWSDHNNCSLVLQVCFGQVSFLFTGDIIAPAEAEIIRRHGQTPLQSTILMVPHHGSRTSSSSAFIEAVRPKEAVISSGWQNRFGFPHAQVVQRLESVSARIWRTSHCGAVKVVTDGHTYQVRPFRSAGNNHAN